MCVWLLPLTSFNVPLNPMNILPEVCCCFSMPCYCLMVYMPCIHIPSFMATTANIRHVVIGKFSLFLINCLRLFVVVYKPVMFMIVVDIAMHIHTHFHGHYCYH